MNRDFRHRRRRVRTSVVPIAHVRSSAVGRVVYTSDLSARASSELASMPRYLCCRRCRHHPRRQSAPVPKRRRLRLPTHAGQCTREPRSHCRAYLRAFATPARHRHLRNMPPSPSCQPHRGRERERGGREEEKEDAFSQRAFTRAVCVMGRVPFLLASFDRRSPASSS